MSPCLGRTLPVLLALLVGCTSKGPTDPILIGHVAPLSGPQKSSGEQAKQSIRLVVEEANKEDNRIHSRNVSVLHADDRGEAEMTKDVATRLITVNKVTALVGGADAGEAERLAGVGQAYSVPVLTLAGLPQQPGEGVYSVNVSPSYQGEILARFAAQELKVNRVGVLVDSRSSFSTSLAAGFAKQFTKDRVDEWTYQKEGEFAELASRVKKAKPEAIIIAGTAADFLKLRTRLQEEGLTVPVLFGNSEGSLQGLQADRATSNGTYLATPYVAASTAAANQEFVKQYQDQFGEAPGADAALAYDAARILFEAMRRAKPLNAEIRKELGQTDNFASLTGPLAFGKDRHARRVVYLIQLDNGQPKLVKQYEPAEK